MKLTAKTDLDAPAGSIYESLTDYPYWEREGVRRGVEIERPPGPAVGVGASWRISGRYRGKQRKLLLKVQRQVPGEMVEYTFDSPSAEGNIVLEFSALSARRSRLRVAIEVKPKTLAARLFVNTLRLAKGRVENRLEARLATLGANLKQRHDRNQARV